MPNVWCHIILGNEFTRYLPDDVRKDIYSGPCHPVFRFGALGPDFFLFDSWNHAYLHSRHDISSYLHRHRCKDALMYSIDKVKQEKQSGHPWWTQAVYTLGTASHFVVDTSIHPLVYRIVPHSIGYRNYHVKLEVEMDVYMAEYTGMGSSHIMQNPAANLVIPQNAPYEICRYYHDLINDFYKGELKPISYNGVMKAMKSYIAVFECLRTRGTLYKLSRAAAVASFGKVRFDWMWHPPQVSDDVRRHLEGNNFWDICNEAIEIGEQLLPTIWAYWHNQADRSEVRALMPKRNYLGDPED